ncbi:MAG TPA: hypothetical protein VMT91_09945 [Anaerolineales bacterium]|nr:hypothetical protein [Anaerolineales bacterium]
MKNVINGKVLIAMVVIALVLLCGSLAYILVKRPMANSSPGMAAATSALTIIPAQTSTPLPLPPTLTPIPPTAAPSATPGPGQIAIGIYVQPSTGGVGLRVHTDPSLSADFFSAFDSEVFKVTKGPEQADGYTWWYLTASYDANRAGWAVQDYLNAIPSP